MAYWTSMNGKPTLPEPKRSTSAFTLIELLVVIAIIALLAAITMPAVTGALRSAAHSKSMSNLRQWGNALQVYLVDHEFTMPGRGPGQQPTWLQASSVFADEVKYAWYNVLPPYVDEPGIFEIPEGERENFLRGATLHRDPQAEFDSDALSIRPLFSYAFNSQLNTSREHGNEVPGRGDIRSERLNITAFEHPTRTVTFFETRTGPDDGHPSQQKSSQYARAYGHSRHLSFRYKGKVNLLFLDGSVRRYNSDDLFNGKDVVNDEVYWSGLK